MAADAVCYCPMKTNWIEQVLFSGVHWFKRLCLGTCHHGRQLNTGGKRIWHPGAVCGSSENTQWGKLPCRYLFSYKLPLLLFRSGYAWLLSKRNAKTHTMWMKRASGLLQSQWLILVQPLTSQFCVLHLIFCALHTVQENTQHMDFTRAGMTH